MCVCVCVVCAREKRFMLIVRVVLWVICVSGMCVCVCVCVFLKGNIYIYMHIHVCGDIRVSVCEPVGERGISVECVSSGLLATRRALKGTSVKIWHCGISFICNKQLITLRGTRSHTHTHTTSVHFQRTST